MKLKSTLVLLLLASSSFAQTKPAAKPTPKPTPKPVTKAVPVVPKAFLEDSKLYAETEVVRLEKEIAASAKNPNLQPCDYFEMKIQLKYNQWFLEPTHYEEFKKMSTSVDSAITTINDKLSSLENETVNVLVREGADAKTSEVPVAFKDLVDFFRLYDQRMKSCPKNQKAALIDMMENEPITNSMNVVLSQLRAAGGMMSVNLNASLQEQGATYDLVMTPKECGYGLDLRVEMTVNGVKQVHRFSLLDGDPSANKLALGERAKWEMLVKGRVDEMPVDGLLRYRKFQDQFRGKCDNTAFARIPAKRQGLPYVKYSEVPAIIKTLEKQQPVAGLDLEFTPIEPGTFVMSEGGGRHPVTLTEAFEMQVFETTQAQWFAVMKNNPSEFKTAGHCPKTWSNEVDSKGMCPLNPVDLVSWNDVQNYIQILNKQSDGYTYRLPTEAEWEYAARAGSNNTFFYGNSEEDVKNLSWHIDNSGQYSHEVGTAGPNNEGVANAFGLYDMAGNSWEWVQDWYGDLPNQAVTNPQGPASGSTRVLRGGCWGHTPAQLRTSLRYKDATPGNSFKSTSFRLVRTPK